MTKHSRSEDDTATLALSIPAPHPDLFRHKATNDILRLLVDNPYETFTIRELSRLTDHSTYSTKSAVDVLEANGLVSATAEGNRRPVGINRDRLSKPDDSVLQIPQPEFHHPVRAAIEKLRSELDDVRGILVFGSVARGQADRQSDIDLWVLVADSRGEQHRGNEVAKELSQRPFDGDRYTFQVLVETLDSAEGYANQLSEIFTDAITLYETEALEALKREVLTSG
ncbi:nucleotidyltransferase domain-containing protein [Natrialbaceae archaeon A-chndr2]